MCAGAAMLKLLRFSPLIPVILMVHGVYCDDDDCDDNKWCVKYCRSHICALKDSTVTLSCCYKYPKTHQIRKVFWTKGVKKGEEFPDLSVDPQYSQRLQYVGDKQKRSTVRLSHVTLDDSHEYYCRIITDKDKWISKSGVALSVTDLHLESPDPVKEGGQVRLTCKSSCELTDRPTFIWSRNSQRFPSANTGNKLTLSAVTRGDAGTYRCAVDGHNLTSDGVQLNVMYPPDRPEISISGSGEIVEGDSVSLICETDSNPPAQIHWIKGGTIVGSGGIYNISNIRSDDSGEYKCRSRNTHGEKVSDTVTLNVMYPPRSVSVLINGSSEIYAGDSVSLICETDSNPPAQIHWFKGGSIVGSGGIYNISNISVNDSGEYKCRSRNTHGEKYSDTVTLNVMYPPRSVSVWINGSDEIYAGDSVSLICETDSNPPAQIHWFKENQSSSVGSGQSFSVGQSGRFYCQAHNRLGSHTSHTVSVTVSALVSQKHNTSVYTVAAIATGCAVLFLISVLVFVRRRKESVVSDEKQPQVVSVSGRMNSDDAFYSKLSPHNIRTENTPPSTDSDITYAKIQHTRANEPTYENCRCAERSRVKANPSVLYSTVQ